MTTIVAQVWLLICHCICRITIDFKIFELNDNFRSSICAMKADKGIFSSFDGILHFTAVCSGDSYSCRFNWTGRVSHSARFNCTMLTSLVLKSARFLTPLITEKHRLFSNSNPSDLPEKFAISNRNSVCKTLFE